ncbi:MAG: beta-lactamase family protein [Coriobacteriales bacterium]|nr:beta-lactamase family protein [Coriobacteriales bacterium]
MQRLSTITNICAVIIGMLLIFLMLYKPSQGLALQTETDTGIAVDTYVSSGTGIRGLAVAATQNGEISFERYIGSYNTQGDQPTSDTLFEWGRCSDLFIWIGLLQLAESQQIDLNDTVSQYLSSTFELPSGAQNITILDLMNHTTGLDVAVMGSKSSVPANARSIEAARALFSIEVFANAGETVAYTPYEAVLGAAVIENVSKLDICDYIENKILQPLGIETVYLSVGGNTQNFIDLYQDPILKNNLAIGYESNIGSTKKLLTNLSGSVFTCVGSAYDLLTLANALVLPYYNHSQSLLFQEEQSVEHIFDVTRTYPGIGTERIAHGFFAFPLTPGVYGLSASISTGFSASLYMEPSMGFAVVVLTNESDRADITEGITRLCFGRSEISVEGSAGVSNAIWTGTYQDASYPSHGPTKILTSLERTKVGMNTNGVLTFNGLTMTSLGGYVYSIDTSLDQDVYRFHVSLQRGAEYSRVNGDASVVPQSQLVVETGIVVGLILSIILCLFEVILAVIAKIRQKLLHKAIHDQKISLSLAIVVLISCALAGSMLYLLLNGVDTNALEMSRLIERMIAILMVAMALYAIFSSVLSTKKTKVQRLRCAVIASSALIVFANLIYWEILI